MTKLENETMLKLAVNGDKDAFAQLIEHYYSTIYKIAYKWSGNQQQAEDITQETCLKIGRSIQNFRFECQFTSWLYRITINTAQDLSKKNKKHLPIEHLPESQQAVEAKDGSDKAAELWRHILTLPDHQKEVMILVYLEGLSHKEAAEIMQCAESTISWYIHQSKKILMEMVVENAR